ncbi:hypothetical protein BC831DRAFT_453061 [Entophlyctis helioformis]|nr:hypothetical protein BC831DRAFT_453061 [Entophlyctis helioformis]
MTAQTLHALPGLASLFCVLQTRLASCCYHMTARSSSSSTLAHCECVMAACEMAIGCWASFSLWMILPCWTALYPCRVASTRRQPERVVLSSSLLCDDRVQPSHSRQSPPSSVQGSKDGVQQASDRPQTDRARVQMHRDRIAIRHGRRQQGWTASCLIAMARHKPHTTIDLPADLAVMGHQFSRAGTVGVAT